MSLKPVCALIVRRDGMTARLTNLDANVEVTATGYAGTYEASGGVSVSAVKSNSSMATDNAEISGAMQIGISLPMLPGDIEGGVWDMARVKVFEVDPENPSSVNVLLIGPIGKIKRTFEGEYVLEVRNLLQLVQQKMGETYQLTCRAKLGSGEEEPVIRRCGVDLALFEVSGSVTSIDRQQFSWYDAALAGSPSEYPTGWFRDGNVNWTSGANAGRRSQIRRHLDTGLIVLDEQSPYAFEVGDTYVLTPGCDHTFATCKNKFGNWKNFRGEDKLPGMDSVLAELGTIE